MLSCCMQALRSSCPTVQDNDGVDGDQWEAPGTASFSINMHKLL